MGITIGSNIASLQAQRRLFETSDVLSSVFERLASGQRINRASDDAAGLAIASSLNADTRVFTQAVRNANDGLSMLSVGEGALLELTNITIRLSELAEQSANGTFSSVQRESLHEEGVALVDEYNRIVESTKFGKKDLFRAEDLSTRLQLGYGLDGSLEVSLGADLARQAGDGTFQSRYTVTGNDGVALESMTLGDLNRDGNLDIINSGFVLGRTYIQLGNGDGTFQSAVTYSNMGDKALVGDVNNDQILDVFGYRNSGTDDFQVMLGNGDGTFGAAVSFDVGYNIEEAVLFDVNNDGNLDAVVANTSTVSIAYGNGDGTFQSAQTIANGFNSLSAISVGDIDGDSIAEITASDYSNNFTTVLSSTGNGSFQSVLSYYGTHLIENRMVDLNNDDNLDVVTLSSNGSDYIGIRLGNGDGTFQAQISLATTIQSNATGFDIGDLNGDGILDLVHSTQVAEGIVVLLGNGDGSFRSAPSLEQGGGGGALEIGDINNDGALDILNNNRSARAVSIHLGNPTDIMTILEFDLRTQESSLSAMAEIVEVRDRILEERSAIGAQTSRVEVAVANLFSARENYKAAESRIIDADIAEESALLVRTNILQQAAASVLAQANQQPALALQLLGGG